MVKLKRDRIKYIRDRAKSKYEKGNACEICDSTVRLDFHHFSTLVLLLDEWLKEKVEVRAEHYTDEYITIWRDEFIEDNWEELYSNTATLCHKHHLKLHSIYGRNPPLNTASKQMRWVEIQREKLNGMV